MHSECVSAMRTWDVAVVGAGIVGCSIAREIKLRHPSKSVVVLEKEDRAGMHTSSRNSGVIHSGINQTPGSLKAAMCVKGSALLRDFCRNSGIPEIGVGTVVVARNDNESATIRELEKRANANGVQGVRIVDQKELSRIEPYAAGREALVSPTGAIVDSGKLVSGMAADAAKNGVSMVFNAKVKEIGDKGNELKVQTSNSEFHVKFLINCAGLYADEVAWMMGVGRDYFVIPFRGDYYRLKPERSHMVNSMIYPPPNLELPFLGIHLTKRTDGSVIVGPNASLALGRENYKGSGINWGEALRTISNTRFIRLMADFDFLQIALKELKLSTSRKAFLNATRELVPAIAENDLIPDQSGMRAQLVDGKGHLVEDFLFEKTDKSFHILNAVSPAMTSALSFAEHVVGLAFE
jgi:(S)-2-hydroxyglutarate dehydrogenase